MIMYTLKIIILISILFFGKFYKINFKILKLLLNFLVVIIACGQNQQGKNKLSFFISSNRLS